MSQSIVVTAMVATVVFGHRAPTRAVIYRGQLPRVSSRRQHAIAHRGRDYSRLYLRRPSALRRSEGWLFLRPPPVAPFPLSSPVRFFHSARILSDSLPASQPRSGTKNEAHVRSHRQEPGARSISRSSSRWIRPLLSSAPFCPTHQHERARAHTRTRRWLTRAHGPTK